MRALWYAKFFRLWLVYDKYPWELGYKPYIEFDNIFPMMIREYNKRVKHERETKEAFDKMKQGS